MLVLGCSATETKKQICYDMIYSLDSNFLPEDWAWTGRPSSFAFDMHQIRRHPVVNREVQLYPNPFCLYLFALWNKGEKIVI